MGFLQDALGSDPHAFGEDPPALLQAARALIAAGGYGAPAALISAFQAAYNAAGNAPPLATSGIYDAATDAALLRFRVAGMSFGDDSGDVQSAANALLAAFPNAPGSLVKTFQQAYNAANGSSPIGVDGMWGPDTARAFSRYAAIPGQPLVKTVISAQQFANLLAAAWPAVVGGIAPAEAIAVLLAQSAFETGQWAHCYNWNFGNVIHVAGDGYDYYIGGDHDGANNPITHPFRSFPTALDGVKDYLSFLYKKYSNAWTFVMAGDPAGFIDSLKAHGYFVGNLDDYRNGVVGYFNKFKSLIPSPQEALKYGAKTAGIGIGVYVLGGVVFLAGLTLYEFLSRK